MAKGNIRNTKTSSFGVSKRIGHDSSKFYDSKLYENINQVGLPCSQTENVIDKKYLNSIIDSSSEDMKELPDNSIHLMVTSPPYNVGKDYDSDITLNEYRDFLIAIWRECYRVLVWGARVCINIANVGRKPYIPLHSFIIEDMLKVGFLMRGEVIWNKGASSGTSTAWGSWQSASNPTLRDVHEYILIFSKGNFKREKRDKVNTITKDEFLEYTKSVWTFPTVSAKKIGHPAPFPIELPYRCIQLYTFKDEVILDPFIGSGQTAIASLKSDRFFIGYEVDIDYAKLAKQRISLEDEPSLFKL